MTTPLWKRVIARILEALLAIIFISPLVWVIICSFSPQAVRPSPRAGAWPTT